MPFWRMKSHEVGAGMERVDKLVVMLLLFLAFMRLLSMWVSI